ncbi:MAG: TonB-dependent receptor [Bacteroidia bacterium]|nr:TonB-dependent receptor [Bacteroidia bacterium]
MRRLLGSLGVLLGLCVPFFLQAQSLEGKIQHKFSGKALKGVKILVINQERSFQSDKEGRFRIEELEVGTNWIEISHPGFRTQKKELFFAKDFQDEYWTINLCPGPSTQFDEEISLGTKTEIPVHESPFFTQEFDQVEFREYASRNMSEALLKIPGMWVREFGPAQSSPIIRGLGGDFNSLLVDGIRTNHSLMGKFSPSILGSVDPFHLQSAEILFGSASTQYGSDALGGVVSLQSKDPDFSDDGVQFHGHSLFRFLGQGSEQSGAGALELNSSRLAVLSSYSRRNLGGLIPGSSGENFQQESALLKAKLKISPRHLFSISYQKHIQRNAHSRESGRPVEQLQDKLKPLQWQMAHARFSSQSKNKWFKEMRISGAFQQYDENREQELPQENLSRKEENQSKIWTGIFEVHSQPNIYWDIVSGVEVYQEGIQSQAFQGRSGLGDLNIVNPRYLDQGQSGSMDIYSLHTFKLVKLRLSLGGRAHRSLIKAEDPEFGDQSLNPNAFSGNISAVYPLTKHIFFSSSFNTGFRNPNIYDISSFGTQEDRFELPTDSLAAERSFSSQIGLKAKTQSFIGSLVLYRTRLNDLIDYLPGNYLGNSVYEGRQVVQKVNSGQAYIQGIEASLEIPLSRSMAFYGSIMYTSGEKMEDQTPLSSIAPLNGRLGFRMRAKSGVWTRLEWQKAGRQDELSISDRTNPYIGPNGTPSWNVLNLHVGYDFNWGYMTLGVQNFFDQNYRVHGSYVDGIDRVVLLSMQLGF